MTPYSLFEPDWVLFVRVLLGIGLAQNHPLLDDQLDAIAISEIHKQINLLTQQEQVTIWLRFCVPKFTLEEVGRKLNITRSRVRQREASALRKLRHPTRLNPIMHAIGI